MPGVTIPLPADRTRVRSPTRAAISALSPMAAIVSPTTAIAPTQGWAESPVQTRP